MSEPVPGPAALAGLLARYRQLEGDPLAAAERLHLAQRIAESSPRADAWMNLAFERFTAYRFGAGHEALARALELDPDFLPARWARFQLPHEVAPASAAEADGFRQRWSDGLAGFEALDFHDPRWRPQVWGCIGQATAFYRHYLGECTQEQRRYGALVQRMMATLDPGIDTRRMPRRTRPRVVFASNYVREHTVGRLFAPLIAGLDPARYELHVLHLDAVHDARTASVERNATLHRGPRHAQDWRQLIARIAPDVIVYLDIGMDPVTQGLAALRLAPLQAVMWGHPVTTGLPTVDAFLSPDAMEPAQARGQYTERLWRLPGLGHGLDPPTQAPTPVDLGRKPGSIELFCAQSVYKLLPGQDALFARILARLPQARLHLIPHPEPHVREWIAARIGRACEAAGVDPRTRLVLHPMQSLAGFLGIAAACDLALDSIGWSGGMSSLDLLGAALPVVTLPADTMRSRQTAALLERMGATELVAHDEDHYVEIAVGFAADPMRLLACRQRLEAARARLHERAPVVAALDRFLSGASA